MSCEKVLCFSLGRLVIGAFHLVEMVSMLSIFHESL